jgi:ATP-dependent Lon protease
MQTLVNLTTLDQEAESFSDIQTLLSRVEQCNAPEDLKEECRKMIARVYRMAKRGSYSQEYDSAAKYIDWVTRIPWGVYTQDTVDIDAIRAELDKYHYGLGKVKDRILSYMAVIQLRDTSNGGQSEGMTTSMMRPPVLCFVGLQGLGKTTIAKSIANALNRKFERISMAAFGSIAQLRGSSKANVDAEPGMIIQAVVRSGSMNPIILLDEIDKSSGVETLRNDIMAALLEILDPAQNESFVDRYINYPVDLSKVFFITTANTLGTLTAALLDRLEIIRFTSYSDEEKVFIAQNYLMPRVLKESGLTSEQFIIDPEVWLQIVRPMGYDAGIRQLERNLLNVARRVAYQIVNKETNQVQITLDNVKRYLPEDMGVLG